jgi:hypothetical protein
MRHVVVASFVQLSVFGLAASCAYPPLDKIVLPQEVKDLPVTVSHDVDLLFLVDDSPSMADKQSNLAANFPGFIDTLSAIYGGLPNVHIGVVTSDLGTQGADGMPPGPAIGAVGQGGCGGTGKDAALQVFAAAAQITGRFVIDVADPVSGTRTRNYTGNLADVFAQMAKAGAGGCGFEQQLEAVKRALDPANPFNQGFLRPEAYLGVILITDEDDCSIEHSSLLGPVTAALGPQQSFRCTRFGVVCDDGGATSDAMNVVGPKAGCHPNDASDYLTRVSDYAGFLRSLKADPSKIIVAAIAGTTEPFAVELRAPSTGAAVIPALAHSCSYTGGDGTPEVADPPIRIKSLLDQFPLRSAFASICQQDLSAGLRQFGEVFKSALGDPCIVGTLADLDPRTPGAQNECKVTVTDPTRPTQAVTELPRCAPQDAAATNQPCWHLAVDAATCPSNDHVKLVIEGMSMLPAVAHVVASCSVQSAS